MKRIIFIFLFCLYILTMNAENIHSLSYNKGGIAVDNTFLNVFVNPALVKMGNVFSFSYIANIDGSFNLFSAYKFYTTERNIFALSFEYDDYGRFFDGENFYKYNSKSLVFTYKTGMFKFFKCGINLKYNNEYILSLYNNEFSIDLGVFKVFRIGINKLNFGINIKDVIKYSSGIFFYPDLGFGIDFDSFLSGKNCLFYADGILEEEFSVIRGVLGLKFEILKNLFFNISNGFSKNKLLNAGAGIEYNVKNENRKYSLYYSISQFGYTGIMNGIGLEIKFN